MKNDSPHLSDETLVRHIDGELPKHDENDAGAHLETCWSCRTRREEFEGAIADFVHAHRKSFEDKMALPDGPRALLKARLSEVADPSPRRPVSLLPAWGVVSLAAFVLSSLGVGLIRFGVERFHPHSHSAVIVLPDSRLTPGATVLADRLAVCAEPDTKNKSVSIDLRQKVFNEYGMKSADPAAYEVDYLVTPALGGADDIHNLWPHSYSATPWNAQVKDELEDRLRDMVCDGTLELTAAQQEIATNWITAYKKYFHTDKALDPYCRRCIP